MAKIDLIAHTKEEGIELIAALYGVKPEDLQVLHYDETEKLLVTKHGDTVLINGMPEATYREYVAMYQGGMPRIGCQLVGLALGIYGARCLVTAAAEAGVAFTGFGLVSLVATVVGGHLGSRLAAKAHDIVRRPKFEAAEMSAFEAMVSA